MALYNLARMNTFTTGSGTITLQNAIAGAITFAQSGVPNGAVISYGIHENNSSEVGRGTYLSAGPTLSRDTVLKSTNNGLPIILTGNAEVFVTVLAEDFEIVPLKINTKANITASTPVLGLAAFASDTGELYIANGTNWLHVVPNKAVISGSNPDMGVEQDSAPTGYGDTYLTDKTLNSVVVGANGTASTGGIRVTSSGFQVYLNGAWNTIVNNFVLREDAAFGYTLEHAPIGFTNYIELMTGQSLNNLGLNGYPLVNAYKASMGAYPFPTIVGGRTIE